MIPDNVWLVENEAIKKFEAMDYTTAIDKFIEVLDVVVDDPRVHFNLALALAKLGELKSSLDVLKNGLDIDGRDTHAIKLLSFLYTSIKGKGIHKMLEEYPWIVHYLRDKGLMANYLDAPAVTAIVDEMLAASNDANHEYGRTGALTSISTGGAGKPGVQESPAQLGSMNATQLAFIVPESNHCYRFLSLPCLDVTFNQAIISRIISSYEDLVEAERPIALVWIFEQGKKKYDDAEYDEAVAILESLATVEPANLAILFYCGKALRDSGDMNMTTRSIEYYKRILQLNYDNALGWYDLSLSYAIIGDFQRELFCIERAFDLGHSRHDYARIAYLREITAPANPFE